ncbi:MAG: hypothetical protein OHK0023_11610 [Anaerolineae bacterium]
MKPKLNLALLDHITENAIQPDTQLQSLNELADVLDINVGKVREQLEVARALGVVDVRPRTGIRTKSYDFLPAVRLSLLYGLALNPQLFYRFAELRNHLEVAFWHEAVVLLTDADLAALQELCDRALAKLNNAPFIQIPHQEHRDFHTRIFSHLDNIFVKSLLAAYWEAYEAVELNTYAELSYWQEAWRYHLKILEHLSSKEYEAALAAFIEHTRLLRHNHGVTHEELGEEVARLAPAEVGNE